VKREELVIERIILVLILPTKNREEETILDEPMTRTIQPFGDAELKFAKFIWGKVQEQVEQYQPCQVELQH
jgi:hypothetical protein